MAGKEAERRRREDAQRESAWLPTTISHRRNKPITKQQLADKLLEEQAAADEKDQEVSE
jgi:hypothetical protein